MFAILHAGVAVASVVHDQNSGIIVHVKSSGGIDVEFNIAEGASASVDLSDSTVKSTDANKLYFVPFETSREQYTLKLFQTSKAEETLTHQSVATYSLKKDQVARLTIQNQTFELSVSGRAATPNAIQTRGACWLDCIGAPHGSGGVHCPVRKTWCYVQ